MTIDDPDHRSIATHRTRHHIPPDVDGFGPPPPIDDIEQLRTFMST